MIHGRPRLTKFPRVALLALGFVLLVSAWIMATEPFAAPDEASHYLRALSISNGHILGPKVRYPTVRGLTVTQMSFLQHDTRGVIVPARLSPPNVLCLNGEPDLTGTCLEATPNGNFPPLAYILPAVALSLSHDRMSAIWFTRVASALPSLAFLLLALALLWAGTGLSVLGLLAATTPMVLFVSSVMNSSGIEITACIAFAAAVLRITRAPDRVPRWCWVAFALAGAVAIVAWPLGVAFVGGDLALFAVLLGRDGLHELRTRNRNPLRVSGLALLGAAAIWLIYARLSDLGSGRFGISPIRQSLDAGVHQLPTVLRDSVGSFASLTVQLPLGAYWIWWLLVVAVLIAALWLGARRDRFVLGATALLALAFPVLFYAWFDRFTGFDLEGREVLPALLLIPLLAGEVIYRRTPATTALRSTQLIVGAAIGLVALFQGYAWWFSARAAANQPHAIRFYAHAAWSPPLGWLPWIWLAVLGTVALISFAVSEVVRRPVAVGRRPAGGEPAAV